MSPNTDYSSLSFWEEIADCEIASYSIWKMIIIPLSFFQYRSKKSLIIKVTMNSNAEFYLIKFQIRRGSVGLFHSVDPIQNHRIHFETETDHRRF